MASGAVNVRRAKAFFERHTAAFNLASLALLLALCFAYVVQVNGSVRLGYDMRELEDRIGDLALKNEQLEANARESQALEHVSRAVKMLGFVSAETPQFVDASTPSVAFAP
jgi:hypothetical protein